AGGNQVADGIGDIGVRLWDASTGKELGVLKGHSSRVYSVAFAPDGKTLASSSFDGSIRIWDVEKRETVRCIDNPEGHIAFSPDGKKLAVDGYSSGKIRLFNSES